MISQSMRINLSEKCELKILVQKTKNSIYWNTEKNLTGIVINKNKGRRFLK